MFVTFVRPFSSAPPLPEKYDEFRSLLFHYTPAPTQNLKISVYILLHIVKYIEGQFIPKLQDKSIQWKGLEIKRTQRISIQAHKKDWHNSDEWTLMSECSRKLSIMRNLNQDPRSKLLKTLHLFQSQKNLIFSINSSGKMLCSVLVQDKWYGKVIPQN